MNETIEKKSKPKGRGKANAVITAEALAAAVDALSKAMHQPPPPPRQANLEALAPMIEGLLAKGWRWADIEAQVHQHLRGVSRQRLAAALGRYKSKKPKQGEAVIRQAA